MQSVSCSGRLALAGAALAVVMGLGSAIGTPFAPAAEAALITRTLAFTAVGFQGSVPAPTDPVTGSFSVTYDDAANVAPTTVGFDLLSLNIAAPEPTRFAYDTALDRLSIGSGPGTFCNVASGFAGFCLLIGNVSDLAAAGATLFYATAADSAHTWTSQSVRLQDISAVPEPATLALFGLGLATLGAARRRRR